MRAAAGDLADDRVGGYYLFAGLLVAFLIVFRALQLSHVGWAFRALRDDEMAAELAGVERRRDTGSTRRRRVGDDRPDRRALAYSAGFISPATYGFDRVDVRVLVLVAFGGLGTLARPGDRRGRVRDPRRAADGEPRAARGALRRLRDRDLSRLQAWRRACARRSVRPSRRPSSTFAARLQPSREQEATTVPRGTTRTRRPRRRRSGSASSCSAGSSSRASASLSSVLSRSSACRGHRSGSPS